MKLHYVNIIVSFAAIYGIVACCNSDYRKNGTVAMSILGRTVPIVDSLCQSVGQAQIILLCSPYDCSSCLGVAFDELKRIDSKSSLNPCVVIGLLSDPSPLQTRYSYYNYIVFDQDDIIRKSLKYVPTPIFVVYDGNNKVVKCHIPTKQDNRENISNLLLNTLLNQNLL